MEINHELPAWECPETLSTVERLSLANQFKILSALNASDRHEALRYQHLAEIVQSGYKDHYYLVFGETEPELSKEHQRLLNQILGMFRAINHGLAALDSATRNQLLADSQFSLTFEGFDFNNSLEFRLHRYLTFLLAIGNWADMKPQVESLPDGGDSNTPRLTQYLKMLAVHEAIKLEMKSRIGLPARDQFLLNPSDLLRLTSNS